MRLRGPRRAQGSTPRSLRALAGPVLAAALVGLAVGRFVALGPSGPQEPLPEEPPVSQAPPADPLAEARSRTEAAPEDAGAWVALGLAATQQVIREADPASADVAAAAFDRAEALVPGDPDALVGRGVLALTLHRFSEALDLGMRAVAARPDHAGGLGVLVDAQVELGRYEEAAATLQHLLDVRPDLRALSRAAYLRELRGDLRGAETALLQAEAAGGAPGDLATVSALRGDLALRRGDPAGAEAAYARALDADPENLAAALGWARALVAQGDLEGAIVAAGELAARRPLPGALALHADLLRAAGRGAEADDAAAVVRAALRLAEAGGQVADLELARFEADHDGDALPAARRAYDARPGNVFAAGALGWALHRSGRTADALEPTRAALRLGGGDAGLRARAALVLAAAGDDAAAREALTAALAEAPQDAVPIATEVAALAARLDVPVPTAWAGLAGRVTAGSR